MVVHEDVGVPMEIPTEKRSRREPKKFIVVQNHVREIISTGKKASNTEFDINTTCQITENVSERLRKKPSKNINIKAPSLTSLTVTEESTNAKPSEISNSDLEELRTVYNKCKEVIKKIETKYGHLLNVITDTSSDPLKNNTNDEVDEECRCSMNKKIIFKDDGEQETIDTDKQGHICLKKLKRASIDTPSISRNIEIQYSENDLQLPDDLETLSNMLKNPGIEITYRNKIIEKVKSLKQELLNEIRFNKHSLIEKLKVNPYEVLDFKGTNLASLPGYS